MFEKNDTSKEKNLQKDITIITLDLNFFLLGGNFS